MKGHRDAWNREYRTSEHLALSEEAGEDLLKFTRWLERQSGREFLNPLAMALDLGCGNGRHLVHLARDYGIRGVGYDISDVAIAQAKRLSEGLPIKYEVRSIAGELGAPDSSVTLVLDMMSSHALREAEREKLREEILRVLKPGGWLLFKSFFSEDDLNVKRLLRDNPAGEDDAYIHPEFGYEHVWSEEALRAFFEPHFTVHKLAPSHKHMRSGRAWKRRTITAYLQKV